MEVFDLLERIEKRQVTILRYLLNHQGQASFTELASTMHLDRSTLHADLSALQRVCHGVADQISLQLNGNQISLQQTGQLAAQQLYYQFVKRSLKYQILLNLLHSGATSKADFAADLAISVSTLNRRLHELNQLLAEYNIQIKNGRLVGFENQIRYFYFHLLWFARPYRVNEQEMTDWMIDTFMAKVEQKFDHPFTEAGAMKMRIWLYILEQRRKNNDLAQVQYFPEPTDFSTASFRLTQTLSDPFFEKYIFSWNRHEHIALYMFVQGTMVLDTNNHAAQVLIADAAQQLVVKQLNQRFLAITQKQFDFQQLPTTFQARLLDSLTQIHYNFIHFQGLFRSIYYHSITDQIQSEPRLNAVYQRLLQPETGVLTEFDKYLSWRYLPLLYLMMHESKVLLHVGCDFSMETSAAQAMIGQICAYVPIGIKIALELYSTTATYDVILTDMDRVYSPATPTFVFLNLQNELDVPRLKNFLTAHYFDKLFQ